jgi:hypothetical protein
MFSEIKYGIYTVNGNDHGGHGDSSTPHQKPNPAVPASKPSKPQSKEGKPTPGKK